MTSEIKLFNYGDNAVRTIEKDGEVWFVAKDVCDILELKDVTSALRSLDDDEKMTLQNERSHSGQRGGAQSFNVISEAGLYKLAFRSNKPMAKDFTRWVTHEVIPAIFRTGSYSVQQESSVPAVCEELEEPKLKYLSRGMFNTASKIFDLVFATQQDESVDVASVKKVLALDKIFKAATGASALELAGITLKKDTEKVTHELYSPSGYELPFVEYVAYYNWKDNLIQD